MAPKIENFPPPVFFTQAPIPSDNQPSEREQKVADFASSRSCSTPEMTKKPPTLKTYSPRASLGLNPVPRNHFDIAKVKDKCQGAISHEPITDLLERYLFDVNFRLEVMRKIREGGLQQIKEECTCQQKLMPIISRVEKVKHALGQQYKQFSDVLDMVASHAQNRAIFLTFYEKMYVFPEMSHYHTAKFVDSLILGSSKRKDLVAFLKNINSKVKTIVIEEARRCCVEKLTDGPIYQVNKIKCLANSKGIIDTIVRGNNLCFQELFINGEQVDFSHCSEGRYSHQVMGVILHHLYGKETAEVKLPLVMEEKDIPIVLRLMGLGFWSKILEEIIKKIPSFSPPRLTTSFSKSVVIHLEFADDDHLSLFLMRSVEFFEPTNEKKKIMDMDLCCKIKKGDSGELTEFFIQKVRLLAENPIWDDKLFEDVLD